MISYISCRENHISSFDPLEHCIATSLKGWNSNQHAVGEDSQSPPDKTMDYRFHQINYQSTEAAYFLYRSISGAMKLGVPQKVLVVTPAVIP